MTLNEKIVDEIQNGFSRDKDFDAYEVAAKIEKLIIQEQIELISNLRGLNAGGTEVNLQWKILELSDRLNELNAL